jgi:natural product precursor
MKIKKLERRFVLNKETIANLNRNEMIAVRGGTCMGTCTCDWTKEPPNTKASVGGTC